VNPPYSDHRAIREGPSIHGIWVNALSDLVGEIQELAQEANVQPIPLPGYWLYRKDAEGASRIVELARDEEKVLYSLHGGGYFGLSAHPSTQVVPEESLRISDRKSDDVCGPAHKVLLRKVDCGPHVRRIFSIEYRLSTCAPFPAQLIDALAGYHYLVHTVGFKPDNIIVEGDSAGGHLTLSLARYLVEHIPKMKPGALLLFSPWCDLSVQGQDTESMLFEGDYIPRDTSNSVRLLMGSLKIQMASTSRWISPARVGRFEGFPKTLILAGSAEVLRDQIRELTGKMKRDSGEENIDYVEIEDAVHDTLVLVRREPETRKTFERIAEWIREL